MNDIASIKSLKETIKTLKARIEDEGLKRKPLVFGFENAKLKDIHTFSLPSGYTCPGACMCLTKADRLTGKIKDGPEATVRCFSASQEAVYPIVRKLRWHNMDRLKQAGGEKGLVHLILQSLPDNAKVVRIHVAGDFFSQAYFNAWVTVAQSKPDVIFYAYTKSIPFWLNAATQVPSNLKLNASLGSRFDAQAVEAELKSARIVFSEKEAADFGLEIDKDDSHAFQQDRNFALLVHGTQSPGSAASKAWMAQVMAQRNVNKVAGAANKKKRVQQPPTVESLSNQIVKLEKRLENIMSQPEFVVQRMF